ncbi:hypothetical protein [Pseudonocardia sp. ICBG1293]|uniref:hypothetical protein n=1 Tax=Pseudonocardia sp. ICBG1293 TaxID=2844382 RepID=UPI001CCF0FD8|nr:hypothetical protein [Pseudonocardia sp. ICBG1293]
MTGAVDPRDVLPDGDDWAELGGTRVRKGTVAAFVASARSLEALPPGDPAEAGLTAHLRELLPGLRAVGVLEVFAPRSARLRDALGPT